MKTSDIRQTFVQFHQDRGYTVLPNGSLLDPSIPMTYVMSTGLSQVEMALGSEDNWNGKRGIIIQKVFRHFDVPVVGTSNSHLSFFEMPAAFWFGDANRAARIKHVCKFLTSGLQFPAELLWVTYFSGGEVAGHLFSEDVETCEAWRAVGIPSERIVGAGVGSNFWKQGDGLEGKHRYYKCAPYTEVFFDRGEDLSCGAACGPRCRCGRFVELANTLFVETEIDEAEGTIRPLATPFTEFVVGTERLAMALQGCASIFDIDSLAPIVWAVRELARANELPTTVRTECERVLADHGRALLFLVADGAPPPGKDGRERIVKILIRRIVTRLIMLNLPSDSVADLLDVVIAANPECQQLQRARSVAVDYIRGESERFLKTLAQGRRCFELSLERSSGLLSGEQVVELEKHRGVPMPLVETWLLQRGITIDKAAYEHALHEWRVAIDQRLS